MSVINRMLQDLEARRAGSGQAPAAVRATPPQSDRKRLLFWLVGGAAATAAVALGDWPQWWSAQAARAPQAVALVEAGTASVDVPQARGHADKPGTLAAPTPAPATAPVPAAASRQREPERAASSGARTNGSPPRAAAQPLMLATATYGLEPSLRSTAAQMLVPTQKGAATPADPVPNATPVRSEASGRVDKQMSVQSPAQRAGALHQQGMALAGTGHGRMALERLQQALAIQPTLTAARVQAVILLGEYGQYAEAEALASDGLVLSPGEAQLSYLLARSLAGHGDTAGALAVLDRSANPGADAFGLRAGLWSQQGDFRRAAADYEKALRLQPGNSLWWLGLGVALEAQGQPQQARRVYVRAQGLGMDSHDLNLFLDQKLAALK